MKFSAILLATLATSTSAFAPSRPIVSSKILSAATLEAPESTADATPAVKEPVVADMAVEKDWPVDLSANFVKESERVQP